MSEERRQSIELTIAAAKAQELRQRAAKLRDATDIVIRLEYIYEAARRLQEAEDGQAKGKDLNNALNALEGQIKAREDRLKKERKQDMALVNAVGDLADSLTDRLPR